MNELLRTTILGCIFGTFGTALGGIIGISIKRQSNKFLSFILSFAAGLMLSVVCFDLIPEALSIANILNVLWGIGFGIICMLICEIFVENKEFKIRNFKSDLLKIGIITSIGLAIHNIPEGLAIGSGFEASKILGFSLAIVICIHDIPEGMSMAIPLKNGGIKPTKIMVYIILSGLVTGLGAFIGKIVGGISEKIISICLAFSAGAMLYIVSAELIPESNKLYNGKLSSIANIIGFLLGLIVIQFQ